MKRKVRIYRGCLIATFIAVIMFTVYYAENILKIDIINGLDSSADMAKTVSEDNIENKKVMLFGIQVGVYLETDGVLVAGTSSITGIDGINYEPYLNKVYEGDYIIGINDITVSSKSQLLFLINKYGENSIKLTLRRNEEVFDVLVTPVKTGNTEYKIGVWARDDTQGIGTLTYITEDGYFGALGHGINDVDTNMLLSSNDGLLYKADIWGINKGENGKPGGLCGTIDYEKKNELGIIYKNTNKGIFGEINEAGLEWIKEQYGCEYYEVADKNEICKGKAEIISCISGKVEKYEIKIVEIDTNSNDNKGMVIEITDDNLLDITNGIIQGMSGSPIIQNGKLVGAVTHVFVNNPKKGYGIFIDEMIEN